MRRPARPLTVTDPLSAHLLVGDISGAPGTEYASVNIAGVVYTNVPMLYTGHGLQSGNRVLVASAGGELTILGKLGEGNDSIPGAPVDTSGLLTYPPGVSYYSATTANGWPSNGLLEVLRYNGSGRSVQRLTAASVGAGAAPRFYTRSWGAGSAWTPWTAVGDAAPSQATDATNQGSIPTGAYTAGSPVVGMAYTIPASGRVRVAVEAYAQCWSDQNLISVSFEVRSGGTIGSGTVLHAAHSNHAVLAGMAVNANAPAIGSGRRSLNFTGLTPGSQINARVMHIRTGAASADKVIFRQLDIDPI